jgi:hypothetical protein
LDDTADSVYEAIGQKFLEQCSFDVDGSLSMHGSMISDDLIGHLDSLLEFRENRSKSEWVNELKDILQRLTPADYAVHGKRICLALAECLDRPDTVVRPVERPFPVRRETDSSVYSTARSTGSVRTAKIARSSTQVNAEYSQFPKWLPTVPKGELF